MKFLLENWPFILGIAVLLLGYVRFILYPTLRENDVKNRYQSMAEPRLIWQNSELEKNYWTKYEKEKMRYLDAKNRWAIIQTPVIPYPMNCAFEVEWFGRKYHESTIGMSYSEYLRAGVAFYHRLLAIWHQETYTQFGMKEMMQTTRSQESVDPDKLWQNAN